MYSSRVFNGLPHIRLLATWFTRTLAKNMTLPPRVACMMASRLARFSLLSDSWAPPHTHKIHFRCTLITCLNTGVAKLKGFTKKKVVQKSFFYKVAIKSLTKSSAGIHFYKTRSLPEYNFKWQMNSFKHLFLTKMVITFGAVCFFRISHSGCCRIWRS